MLTDQNRKYIVKEIDPGISDYIKRHKLYSQIIINYGIIGKELMIIHLPSEVSYEISIETNDATIAVVVTSVLLYDKNIGVKLIEKVLQGFLKVLANPELDYMGVMYTAKSNEK